MQQVGAKTFVPAQIADPRLFPTPLPALSPHRRWLASLSHFVVLHRRALRRGLLATLVLASLGGLYIGREPAGAALKRVLTLAEGQVSGAGFAIHAIEITGQTLTADRDIVRLLTLGSGQSIFTFDVAEAQARLQWLRAVQSAKVRKVYPDRIIVDITEKTPVARWRVGAVTWLIDARGERIGTDRASYPDLPLIVGQGAADDTAIMMRLLNRYPNLKTGLVALSRISDRRWDLIYKSGLRVQLPETGTAEALGRLDQYQTAYQLLDRDVLRIDLRIEGLVTLKPGPVAADMVARTMVRPHKIKGPAEYETPVERAQTALPDDSTTGTAPE